MAEAKVSQDRQTTIAGQAFTLRFSTKAIRALRDLWSLSTDGEVLGRVEVQSSDVDVDFAADMVWAALRTHHKDVPRDTVTDLLDDHGISGLPGLVNILIETLQGSMPPPDEVAEARPRKAKAVPSATTN